MAVIHILSGVSAAGIDLSINNIAIKLAPKNEAISYISARNMVVAIFSALGPITGGLLADLMANHQLLWSIKWNGRGSSSSMDVLNLNNSNFYFVIGAVLAALSLNLLKGVREEGEVSKKEALIGIKTEFRNSFHKLNRTSLQQRFGHLVTGPAILKRITMLFSK